MGGNGLGTIAYTAPETFQDGVADMSSDVYAFGILGRLLMSSLPEDIP